MEQLRTVFEPVAAAMPRPDSQSEPKARQLVRDRVFEAVRDAIVEGRIAPGTRLTERELCEAFGISRTVVREIVRRLEAEKLADVVAHRGVRVATLTRKSVTEIYQIRTELEALIVRNFLAVATDRDVATAQEFGEKLLDAGRRHDRVGLAQTMMQFDQFMTEVADMPVLSDMIAQLRTRITMLRVLALAEPGQLETGMDGVRAIIAGITARDAGAAENAVRVYVRRSGEAVLRHMDEG